MALPSDWSKPDDIGSSALGNCANVSPPEPVSVHPTMLLMTASSTNGSGQTTSVTCSNILPKAANNGFLRTKNYKAGSKINQLADMLAKRSQAVVEVTETPPNPTTYDDCLESRLKSSPIREYSFPPDPGVQLDDQNEVQPESTKIATRSSNRSSSDDASSCRATKRRKRKASALVETSTQTTEDSGGQLSVTFACLYCHETFIHTEDCKQHELTHWGKTRKCRKCQFCLRKFPGLEELKSHMASVHADKYHVCSVCSVRFVGAEQLEDHHATHPSPEKKKTSFSLNVDTTMEGGKKGIVSPRSKPSPRDKTEEQMLEQEMLFYSHLAGNIQENLSNHLDGKIGKTIEDPIPKKEASQMSVEQVIPVPQIRAPSPYQTRSKTPNPLPPTAKKFKKLPNWQQKFWEKYNFPANYRFEHRFWDKNYLEQSSALYLKDLSCLDIKTQLTLKENAKKLEEAVKTEKPVDESKRFEFPFSLNLLPVSGKTAVVEITPPASVESSKTGRKKLKRSSKMPAGDSHIVTRSRKGSLDLSSNGSGPKMALRRQSSVDNATTRPEKDSHKSLKRQNSGESLHTDGESRSKEIYSSTLLGETNIISGEWVRARSYLCATCLSKFTNLWELEDHKWVTHANVWCNHYELEDGKLAKLSEASQSDQPLDWPNLYKRNFQSEGTLFSAEHPIVTDEPLSCSKCTKTLPNQAEFHRHILECAGDRTWSQLVHSSPPPATPTRRKWRPFGRRKRRQTTRGTSVHSPSSTKVPSYSYQPRVRSKPGDMETIQKMLANLPEKRVRRAIRFDDVQTRSQSQMLRRRFQATFTNSYLRRKVQENNRRKMVAKKHSANATKSKASDLSSESTPQSSPKRRCKLKNMAVNVASLPSPKTAPNEEASNAPSKRRMLSSQQKLAFKIKKKLNNNIKQRKSARLNDSNNSLVNIRLTSGEAKSTLTQKNSDAPPSIKLSRKRKLKKNQTPLESTSDSSGLLSETGLVNFKRKRCRLKNKLKKPLKQLQMTVTLKEATLKILDTPRPQGTANKWTLPSSASSFGKLTEAEENFSTVKKNYSLFCSKIEQEKSTSDEISSSVVSNDTASDSALATPSDVTDQPITEPSHSIVDVDASTVNNTPASIPEENCTNAEQIEVNDGCSSLEKPPEKTINVLPDDNMGFGEVHETFTCEETRRSSINSTVENISIEENSLESIRSDAGVPKEKLNKKVRNKKGKKLLAEITNEVSNAADHKSTESILDDKTNTIIKTEENLENQLVDEVATKLRRKNEGDKIIDDSTDVENKIVKQVKGRRKKITADRFVQESIEQVNEEVLKPLPSRRCKTRNRESITAITNEFVLNDPFLLVDELWSELDSDSDLEKGKKVKKRKRKKRSAAPKVDLEALLRNFGENNHGMKKKHPERRKVQIKRSLEPISPYLKRRLSLGLFSFNKQAYRRGYHGAFINYRQVKSETNSCNSLPLDVVENPEQVIVCSTKKAKAKSVSIKVSLPLSCLKGLEMFNNNNINSNNNNNNNNGEAVGKSNEEETPKTKAVMDSLDKIFFCEVCETYYYSASQLKNHKNSNRHKQAESKNEVNQSGEDTCEMPVLEGPFLESTVEPRQVPVPEPAPPRLFGFTEEGLKDIQKAIGCTDEEMLILTLLGENNEPDILDLDSWRKERPTENGTNGAVKVDLKQRMTSALTSLVNRAITNLLKKSDDKGEALNFLNKLSDCKAIRKAQKEEHSEMNAELEEELIRYAYECNICGNRFEKESTRDFHVIRTHRRRQQIPKKIKENREPFSIEELTPPSEEFNDLDTTTTTTSDLPNNGLSQFWCSDCGINFVSPKEVLEHQKTVHSCKTAKRSTLDPETEKLLANQALQRLAAPKQSKKGKVASRLRWGADALKFTKKAERKGAGRNEMGKGNGIDVYDFNDEEEHVSAVLEHVRRTKAPGEEYDSEDNLPLATVKGTKISEPLTPPDTINEDKTPQESLRISLENRFLQLSENSNSNVGEEIVEGEETDKEVLEEESKLLTPPLESSWTSSSSSPNNSSDDELNEIIYERNEESSYDSDADATYKKTKKIVPLLTATLTRKSESPKLNKETIVRKIWSRTKPPQMLAKDAIMKRIWQNKQQHKSADVIAVSDEVVIKCGPNKDLNELDEKCGNAEKEAIMRRIWSGRSGGGAIQTKAALKTYESDLVPNVNKRKGKTVKRRIIPDDDLDDLLEEIERENVEKAIRLEFLHLRRSEKAVEHSQGVFKESEEPLAVEKKKRKVMKKDRLDMVEEDDRRNHHHKHRHRHHHHHHHHRHRHKHHRRSVGLLEKLCSDLGSGNRENFIDVGEAEAVLPVGEQISASSSSCSPRITSDLDNLDSKLDEVLV